MMERLRITRLPVIVAALLLVALVMVGLGTVVALWPSPARASRQIGAPSACSPHDPCLSVVIDDVGRDLNTLRQLLALRLDLTYSVLPHARHTAASLAAIRARGRQVMLHLPMAPIDPRRIADEPVVLGRDGPLEAALATCLELVPDAVGVNNHMGSALGRDPAVVRALLRVLGQRGLWFLDSRTASGSLFCAEAPHAGVPCLRRDVFLDDPPSSGLAAQRLQQAVELAHRRGWAVAIAHPQPVTVNLLKQLAQSTRSSRIKVRRLSEVVADGT